MAFEAWLAVLLASPVLLAIPGSTILLVRSGALALTWAKRLVDRSAGAAALARA